MTTSEIYAIIKFWLPLFAAAGFLVKIYLAIRNGLRGYKQSIQGWATNLLDNHLSHIQEATEKTATTLSQMQETDRLVAGAVQQVAKDLKHHQDEDIRIQTQILTGIEVVKARLE